MAGGEKMKKRQQRKKCIANKQTDTDTQWAQDSQIRRMSTTQTDNTCGGKRDGYIQIGIALGTGRRKGWQAGRQAKSSSFVIVLLDNNNHIALHVVDTWAMMMLIPCYHLARPYVKASEREISKIKILNISFVPIWGRVLSGPYKQAINIYQGNYLAAIKPTRRIRIVSLLTLC